MSTDNFAGQIRQKGSHIAEDVMGIGTILKDAASEKLHSIKDAASDKLHAVKDSATDRLESIKDGALTLGRNTRDSVNETVTGSPWKSMFVAAGVAAGMGLVAGLYFRRK